MDEIELVPLSLKPRGHGVYDTKIVHEIVQFYPRASSRAGAAPISARRRDSSPLRVRWRLVETSGLRLR